MIKKFSLVLLSLFIFSVSVCAQSMLERYQKSEQFLPKNISKLVLNASILPVAVENSDDFWYQLQTENGSKYFYFDGKKKKISEAFNHVELANAITNYTGKKISPDSLNLRGLKFLVKKNKVEFTQDTSLLEVDLSDYSVFEKEKEKHLPKNQSKSPNKKWIAKVKEYNLYLEDTETGEEFQLTDDGIEKYEYATPLSWYKLVDETEGDVYDPSIYVSWSEDSKKIVTYRLDRRDVGKLYLYQSMPDSGMRAKVWSYERALPGEEPIKLEFYIFDVVKKSKIKIDIPPFADFLADNYPTWLGNTNELYMSRFRRGYKAIDLFKLDAATGKAGILVTDSSKTMVEYQMANCRWTKDESQFFWTSERDGWNHIYRYNNSGKLLNQVTKGEFVVESIRKIDEKNQRLYFVALGKEPGIDPYYKHLYVVDFEGKNLQLLTSEDAEHEIWIPETGDYFVDSWSRINMPTEHAVRSLKDGKIINKLATANVEKLLATGWRYPEPFKIKARDGKTDIYGAIFFSSDFDPAKKYPVIDGTYSGPQAIRTAKSFARGFCNDDVPLAELGFIVITIDGMGSAWRSKAFHDVSYMNLGDIGAPDHIGGMKQLAETRPWLDLNKVGIYGHSAGGYDAAHAMLTHPEFYKVAVASAGNHDHRIAKAWWPEQYMGMPGKHYDEQSNFNLAGNLEGKLLLIHGDMDNNVNTASSLRLAGELIKNNKDFELLIIPSRDHGLADHPYFIRKRWDWFVKNLMGEEPPKEYEIKSYKN
ncbi:MAG: DPP IV N-terminal domain-containing protein [Prolixibacteraceae bacterium]|nr:DPP IV N-terminal domain-containing protein [Prolixibacteraceae bacterium]